MQEFKRIKYTPDNIVFINQTYKKSFEDFDKDCKSLGIANPLIKDKFCLYTISRGCEEIISDDPEMLGQHMPADGVNNPFMDSIINRVEEFNNIKEPVTEKTLSELLIYTKGVIKWVANVRIESKYPIFKQVNYLIEADPIKIEEMKDFINDIRRKSDLIEKSLSDMTYDQIKKLDVNDDKLW